MFVTVFIFNMNEILVDIKEYIFYNLINENSIVNLRRTSKEHKKIVDFMLRKEYEHELCKLFENLTISRRIKSGECRLKDIIRKEFCNDCDTFYECSPIYLKKESLGPHITTFITFIVMSTLLGCICTVTANTFPYLVQ